MKVDYYFCLTHKCSVLPEDKDEHKTDECEFTMETFSIHDTMKVRYEFASKRVADKLGMKIHKPQPKIKIIKTDTIPSMDVTLDLADRVRQL